MLASTDFDNSFKIFNSIVLYFFFVYCDFFQEACVRVSSPLFLYQKIVVS